MKFSLAAAAAALVLSGAANAATVESLGTEPSPIADPGGVSNGSSAVIGVSGSQSDRTSPWTGSATNSGASYNSILAGGEIGYTFTTAQSALKVLWGTPDSYNYVTFHFADGTKQEINGNAIPYTTEDGLSFGEYVLLTPDSVFTYVTFWSQNTAFEFSAVEGVPAAVPVPAAGLLLAGAVGGLAALRRRKAAAV